MEIKTTWRFCQEHEARKCDKLGEEWVRVDDIIKYLEQYKIDVDDYHSADYFVKKFMDELSKGDN